MKYFRLAPPYLVLDRIAGPGIWECLLLPFDRSDLVEQIIGSYKAISIEGGFKINNLMSVRPKVVPATVIRTVIDHDFVPAANRRSSDDAIEL